MAQGKMYLVGTSHYMHCLLGNEVDTRTYRYASNSQSVNKV